ncbi:MAG: RNA-directed DNA polymerase [Prevotella sp.]
MKRVKDIWQEVTSVDSIITAIENAAEGKKHKRAIKRVLDNKEEYAKRLSKMLREKTFVPSDIREMEIDTEYGKRRKIGILPFFPDHVVHHVIALAMKERWQKSLIDDTYACIEGRGINTKDGRYDLTHKVKRIMNDFKGKPLYCLCLDIKKCYPSINNEILAKIYRETCGDKDLLWLLDTVNFKYNGLIIGSYFSQLLINIYLSKIDRYVKEVVRHKYYVRYMDDIRAYSESKEELHRLKWRIANFAWYELGLELNGKRQVFPIDKRGDDFAGYVFHRGYTSLRKRIKKRFAKRRHNKRSLASYWGIVKNCESHNLIKKVIKEDNMPTFAELGINKIERRFEGVKISIDDVLNVPIKVLDFEFMDSKKKIGTKYAKLQILINGEKRFLAGGWKYIMDILAQIENRRECLPVDTRILNTHKQGYYFEGTIKLNGDE